MILVLGNDFILYRQIDDDWIPYACSRSLTLSINVEYIETSGPGNGLFATYAPTKNSWSASADGVVSLVDAGLLTLPALQASQLAQEVFQVQFTRTDQAGNVFVNLGYVFITGSQESGGYDGVDMFSITIQGTGHLLPLSRFDYVGHGLEFTFIALPTIGKTIISVNRDGRFFRIVDTPPGVGEVENDNSIGSFTFTTQFLTGMPAYVLYY